MVFYTTHLILRSSPSKQAFQIALPGAKQARYRWKEVRIEFEYESKSFEVHGHDPSRADVIVCWIHNWQACPKEIEVLELSTLLGEAEQIDTQIKTTKKLTAWQEFCQIKRLEGLDFGEIAKLWGKQKT